MSDNTVENFKEYYDNKLREEREIAVELLRRENQVMRDRLMTEFNLDIHTTNPVRRAFMKSKGIILGLLMLYCSLHAQTPWQTFFAKVHCTNCPPPIPQNHWACGTVYVGQSNSVHNVGTFSWGTNASVNSITVLPGVPLITGFYTNGDGTITLQVFYTPPNYGPTTVWTNVPDYCFQYSEHLDCGWETWAHGTWDADAIGQPTTNYNLATVVDISPRVYAGWGSQKLFYRLKFSYGF